MRGLLRWTAILGVSTFALFPFYWTIVSSLKTGSDLFNVEYWPSRQTLANYVSVLSEKEFVGSLANSTLVAVLTVSVSLAIAAFAAFSLSRVEFRGRKRVLLMVLSVSMFPQVAVLSGMFELVRVLGLYNQTAGLALSYLILVLPFTVWILTSFMKEIPKELEEAAILDGARSWKILGRIFFPILAPSVVTTALLSFIVSWNEFLFALTLTLSSNSRTVPVAIAMLSGASQFELPWGLLMAASVIVTVPVMILVLIFQKRIVSGLTAGAVKG